MHLISLSPARIKDRIWLQFDTDAILPLKVDDVVRLQLKKFVDLTPQLVEDIRAASSRYLLTDYALRQLAISPRTHRLLTQKLQLYARKISLRYPLLGSVSPELITTVVDELSTRGLLNDQEFVKHYLRRYPLKSAAEIQFRLKHLGVNTSVSSSSDRVKLRHLLAKKAHLVDLTDARSKNRFISNLCRKGFAYDDVKSIIDETLSSG